MVSALKADDSKGSVGPNPTLSARKVDREVRYLVANQRLGLHLEMFNSSTFRQVYVPVYKSG